MIESTIISPKISGEDALLQLFERYKEKRESYIRDILILSHSNLVRFFANKFTGRGESLEDLIQIGTIGLINAVERFDPSRGNKFSSYASPTIVGELKRHFRDKGWKIKVPRNLQELNLRIPKVTEDFVLRFERQPTILELADLLNATEEDTFEALNLGIAYETLSLDELIPDSEGKPLRLEEFQGEIDQKIASINQFGDLYKAIESLDEIDPRYKQIVTLRFFSDLTQTEIAKEVGICQMHVSRLLARALRHLNTFLTNENEMINSEGEDKMSSKRGRHRNRANGNGNGNRTSTVTPASNTTSTLEITEIKPKETVATPITEKKVEVMVATDKPAILKNGLAFLMVEWPRLSYTEPKEINFPHIIKNSPISFVEEQLEPILQNLIHLGIIKEVRNGFLRGKNEVKIGVKQGLEGFYLRNRTFKKDEEIDLNKECNAELPSPPEKYSEEELSSSFSDSSNKKEIQGETKEEEPMIVTTEEKEKRIQTTEDSTIPRVGSNEIRILSEIWGLLQDDQYVLLDYALLSEKTGIPQNSLSTYFNFLKKRSVIDKCQGKGCTFKKGTNHIIRACFLGIPYLVVGENKTRILRNEIIKLDEKFPPSKATENITATDAVAEITDLSPLDKTEPAIHTNGNSKDVQVSSSTDQRVSQSDVPSVIQNENDIPMHAERLGEFARDALIIAEHQNGNSDANSSIIESNNQTNTKSKVTDNLNDVLAKIELKLTSLYAEAGRIKLTIKETEKALVSLRSTSQLLKKDYTSAINDLEEELDDLYIETRNNKLSIASAEESKMALMAKR